MKSRHTNRITVDLDQHDALCSLQDLLQGQSLALLWSPQPCSPDRTVTWAFPFEHEHDVTRVVNGRSDINNNAHLMTLIAALARFRDWRGHSYRSVGNSGNTGEPHGHAQRPGPATAPLGGEPLPIVFGGRFPVCGDRIGAP